MSVEGWFNACESLLWIGIGLFALWKGLRSKSKTLILLALLLGLFGASDGIEIYTGTWWYPWWLLVAKAAILLGITWSFLCWQKYQKK